MMGKWKTCFKLLKYSENLKRSIWAAAIVLLLGLGLFVGVLKGEIRFVTMSVLIILLSLTLLVQLKENFMLSSMVCASSKRRFFDTLFSDVLWVSAGVAAYLIYGVLVLLFLENGDVEEFYAANVLWISGLCITMFIAFLPIYLRYYWSGLITNILLYMLFQEYIDYLEESGKTLLRVSTPIGFWMGLGVVLAGGAVSIVIRRILYKKPFSKWVASENMRKMV